MYEPLYTSTALSYLKSIISKNWKVFEYGGGNSTLFYREQCAEVYTVEHDPNWYSKIVPNNDDRNVKLIGKFEPTLDAAIDIEREFYSKNFYLPIKDDRDLSYNNYHGLVNDEYKGYASTICNHPAGYFDCIVVDGMARTLSLWYAMHMINENGVIILDNSDRWQYNSLQCYLINNGFNRIDCWDPDKVTNPSWCTSFFSKQYNKSDESCERPQYTGDLYHFN